MKCVSVANAAQTHGGKSGPGICSSGFPTFFRRGCSGCFRSRKVGIMCGRSALFKKKAKDLLRELEQSRKVGSKSGYHVWEVLTLPRKSKGFPKGIGAVFRYRVGSKSGHYEWEVLTFQEKAKDLLGELEPPCKPWLSIIHHLPLPVATLYTVDICFFS